MSAKKTLVQLKTPKIHPLEIMAKITEWATDGTPVETKKLIAFSPETSGYAEAHVEKRFLPYFEADERKDLYITGEAAVCRFNESLFRIIPQNLRARLREMVEANPINALRFMEQARTKVSLMSTDNRKVLSETIAAANELCRHRSDEENSQKEKEQKAFELAQKKAANKVLKDATAAHGKADGECEKTLNAVTALRNALSAVRESLAQGKATEEDVTAAEGALTTAEEADNAAKEKSQSALTALKEAQAAADKLKKK